MIWYCFWTLNIEIKQFCYAGILWAHGELGPNFEKRKMNCIKGWKLEIWNSSLDLRHTSQKWGERFHPWKQQIEWRRSMASQETFFCWKVHTFPDSSGNPINRVSKIINKFGMKISDTGSHVITCWKLWITYCPKQRVQKQKKSQKCFQSSLFYLKPFVSVI